MMMLVIIITIVFYSLVKHKEANLISGKNVLECEQFDVYNLATLVFDHADILAASLNDLKYKARHESTGFNLLPESLFCLSYKRFIKQY